MCSFAFISTVSSRIEVVDYRGVVEPEHLELAIVLVLCTSAEIIFV
jgi:hypothetical protein